MKSFTKKLTLIFTGLVLIIFATIATVFNRMAENYILLEATQELTNIANMLDIHPGTDFVHGTAVRVASEIFGSEVILHRSPNNPETFSHIFIDTPIAAPNIIYGLDQAIEFVGVYMDRLSLIRPMRHSFINVDAIFIAGDGHVIHPINHQPSTESAFLSQFYHNHRYRFADNQMVLVHAYNGNTFYISTITQHWGQDPVTVLLYSDITHAIHFVSAMNWRLLMMLGASGVITLGVALWMSRRFKSAVGKLSTQAHNIGQGDFSPTPVTFQDTEFAHLAKSMDNMAQMLQTFENNQKQFFQNVSHELRTPLMSIQGYAEGIVEDVFPKEEAAGIILQEGKKMTDLITELIYVSRLDMISPTEPPVRHPVNLKTLLEETIETIRPLAKDIRITLTTSPTSIVFGDEEKLQRSILNILSNAARYANTYIVITLTNNLLSISNDGPNIPEADLPHIFQRFYKGEQGNFGLGLAIAQDIIKAHGGSIVVTNTPTTFTISL